MLDVTGGRASPAVASANRGSATPAPCGRGAAVDGRGPAPPGPDPPAAGRNSSTLSPAAPITQTVVKTGISEPASKNTSSSIPAAGAVSSKLVLSVSMSAITSPSRTTSPFRTRHPASRHSSTVLPSFGISTAVAICHHLPALPDGQSNSTRNSPLTLEHRATAAADLAQRYRTAADPGDLAARSLGQR